MDENYALLRKKETNLEMNAGSSLASAVMAYIFSLGAAVAAVGINAEGDSDTAIYSGIISLFGFAASGLAGISHDNDVRQLEQVRKEIKGLEAKL